MLKRLVLTTLISISCVSHSAGQEPVGWSGVYAGAHAGYVHGDADVGFLDFALPGLGQGYSADVDGAAVGAQLGARRQLGSIVVGVDAQFDIGRLRGSVGYVGDGSDYFCDAGCQASVRFTSRIDNIFMLTGRLGWAANDAWLLYGKAGYASADVEHRGAVNAEADFCGTAPCSLRGRGGAEERHHGWVIGGGVEHRLTRHLSLALDYSAISLDDATVRGRSSSTVGDVVAPGTITLDVRPEVLHMLAVHLNYAF